MLEVGRAEVDALDAILPTDRAHDVDGDLDIGFGDPDQVKSAADAEHGESLLGHRLQPNEVKYVIGSFRQEIADGLDRFRLRGVDDVGGAKSSGLVESLRLNIDDDDPRRTGDARSAHAIQPNATGADDDDGVASIDMSGVQDGTCTRYNAAAEQRSLGERKLLGNDGELVLVDERPFGA